ncbi:MAG: hypothetical protein IH904_04065 [Proteobacteria bacterium]|nr:hypothetical protein [Pseudomonadota bacterium]
MTDKRPVRSEEELRKRFGWEADDITVRNPAGEIVDIAKKPPEEPTTGKDVNPKVPEEK